MGNVDTNRGEVPRFRWLGPDRVPDNLDLRYRGWTLDRGKAPGPDCLSLLGAAALEHSEAAGRTADLDAAARRTIIVTGVESASRREALLRAGFADAVSGAIGLGELEARAARTAEFIRWLPRLRRLGELELDLLMREAYGRGLPLDLNPREFALLWRLADTPDRSVSKEALIRDVWRMGFVPATNSIAVHMSRLRRKLSFAGMNGVIETMPDGSYRLRAESGGSERAGTEPRRAAASASPYAWRQVAC